MRMKPATRAFPATKRVGTAFLHKGDASTFYDKWPTPTCIIVDGPYGLGKFPGEPHSVVDLPQWYAPHAAAWAKYAAPDTTLWFWGSELSWATVHPVLELTGWQYEEACIWDKGLAHVAGNVNSKTIRGVPIATEVAVRYSRKNLLPDRNGNLLTLKEWVRSEWLRSGLPMNQANIACGVANAATRKYLTQCHLWYFPPADAMQKMADYCNEHGLKTERPYFSVDGRQPFDSAHWEKMRPKWNHVHGWTNVWQEAPVHGKERIKIENGYLHANQKPTALMEFIVNASTAVNDVVWEPFGGLCTGTLAAANLGRRAFASEINNVFFEAAAQRLQAALVQQEAA